MPLNEPHDVFCTCHECVPQENYFNGITPGYRRKEIARRKWQEAKTIEDNDIWSKIRKEQHA